MNTSCEQNGGMYVQKDRYLYPNITIPEEDMQPIGKYGRMEDRYLKQKQTA